jgi:hypothetical protein
MVLLERILAEIAERRIITPLILLDFIFTYSLKCRNFRPQNSFSTASATKRSSSHPTIMSATGRKADMKNLDIMTALEQQHSKAKTKKFCKFFFQIGNLIFFRGLTAGGGMVPNGPPAFDKFAPRPRLKYGTHRV